MIMSCLFLQIFSSYKTKCGDFRRLFKDIPDSEQLIVGEGSSDAEYLLIFSFFSSFREEFEIHEKLLITVSIRQALNYKEVRGYTMQTPGIVIQS